MSGYGMCGHVMVNFQDSYGTSQTTSLQAVPVVNESLVLGIEQIVEQNMYGRLGESPYHEGAHGITGGVSLEAEPTAMGWFMKSVIGTVATTSDTGIQSHVFIPSLCGSEFDTRAATTPLTMEVYRDVGSAGVYYDCVGNQLSISIANGQLLSMDVDFIGAGFSRKAAATPSFPTGKPFTWDQASVEISSQSVVDLEELTVTVNNNLEATHTLTNTKAPYRIKRTGPQQVELSGSMIFAAESYFQAFENQTEVPFKAHFVNNAAPHTFTMDFPKIRFKTFEPQQADAGLIKASFTAQAIFDTGSNRACEFTLVNTQTYY